MFWRANGDPERYCEQNTKYILRQDGNYEELHVNTNIFSFDDYGWGLRPR